MQVDDIETDFSPKPSRDTGEPLDFAIIGEGFFGVRTAQGVRYTRNGQFTVSPQGLLVTARATRCWVAAGGPCAWATTAGWTRGRSRSFALDNPRKEGDNLVAGTPAGTAGTARCAQARWRPRARTRRDPWWT